ncbi:hypothetical protein [uncultured Flavobacterium sp.]|uniref:hypothetical protein n=1 Tax=uncultured Flavobacterium sp. TaxID=165435 RepID=UPI0009670A1F|nr:hypothetical protein [uncultured Flavobacterium sp.]OJX38802.1 MAG: hypothetical protein BGO87_08475 [Flavobacteriia bacterium 40-80]
MKKHKDKLIGLGLILLIIILSQISNHDYEKQMENTSETKAFYIKNFHVKNFGPTSYYYYYVDHHKYQGSFYDTDTFLKKGDTILIKYSKENPSLSEVVDKYYMQKYRGR